MTMDSINAVTHNSNDDFVFHENGVLRGICIDIWEHVAQDLKFSDFRPKALGWMEMMNEFKNKNADVIVERMDDSRLSRANISKEE